MVSALRQKKILVIMGGPSDERDISLKSGKTVLSALRGAGFDVRELDIPIDSATRFLERKLEEIVPDVCFLTLHGRFGEDGEVQRILSRYNIPYTGSGPEASLRAFNKLITKEILLRNNIPTPQYIPIGKGMDSINGLPYPIVVKPACQGSTIGVKVVETQAELSRALREAFMYGDVLAEKFIYGRELTVGIFGDTALPVVEITLGRKNTSEGSARGTIFDYNAKYRDPDTRYIVPAQVTSKVENEVKRLALLTHNALGLKGFSRIDIILDKNEIPYILEANSIPGLSERSLFPMACRASGISFEGMCISLLEMALCKR